MVVIQTLWLVVCIQSMIRDDIKNISENTALLCCYSCWSHVFFPLHCSYHLISDKIFSCIKVVPVKALWWCFTTWAVGLKSCPPCLSLNLQIGSKDLHWPRLHRLTVPTATKCNHFYSHSSYCDHQKSLKFCQLCFSH